MSVSKDLRPHNLKTKIFLDGGDPKETEQIIELLGFLDGQTTNPTLVAKNPDVEKRLKNGEKFTMDELLSFYKTLVGKLSRLIPDGSISIEVFADKNTTASEMFAMGKDMYSWIPNAHVKYPTNAAGIEAAIQTVHMGARVNMTLCFSQEQAAAVYAATKMDTYKTSLPGYKNVFLSPFIGRLDDRGENGMSFIKNVLEMYQTGDQHVEVLSASVRTMDHFMAAIALGSDIITAPFSVLKTWAENGMQIPDKNFVYQTNLKNIPYKKLDLNKDWKTFDIQHDLTDIGIDKFAKDANTLLK
jgi:transaldolase